MPFKPGDPKPKGSGAKKDKPYKKTVIKRTVEAALEEGRIDLKEEIIKELFGPEARDNLMPIERLQMMFKLLEYTDPRLKSVALTGPSGVALFTDLLNELKDGSK